MFMSINAFDYFYDINCFNPLEIKGLNKKKQFCIICCNQCFTSLRI